MATSSIHAQSLQEQFRNPAREFSMAPLWSWNGRLDPAELRRQMDEMTDKGVYGAFMHARAGLNDTETPYFSEGWWKAVDACVTHGPDAGFQPWIYDEDGWPSGSAGGRTLQRNPVRNVQKVLRRVELRYTGPCQVKVAIPDARYVMAAKVVGDRELDPQSLLDLGEFNAASKMWACPEGEWLVMGYVFEPYREGINYLNRETVRDFIDITHEEYARRYGAQFGTTIPGVFFDEIMNDAGKSPNHAIWAEDFETRFREIKGYDLAPLLPALTYNIGPQTPKVRCDYYDVFTTMYEEGWFQQLAEWCAAHRLMLTGHTVEDLNRYITQGDYLRTLRHLDIPTTDNEDFRYTWPRTIGSWKPKQVASIGHLYAKKRIGVEALGGAGWSFTLESGRYGFNMLAAYGVNFYVIHLFHYAQDAPENVDDWPNSWFFQNPYWKYFKILADHVRRVSFMLSGAQHVVDVAILYPQANQWAGYGPGTTEETLDRLVAAQIDADIMDSDSLDRAEIRDAALVIGDMRYRVLVLPGLRCVRRREAVKIAAFLKAGGRVVVQDHWPTDSMDAGTDDSELAPLKDAGAAAGIRPLALEESLRGIAAMLDRDLIVLDADAAPLRYQHVRRDGKEVYWLVNAGRASGEWHISLRAEGRPSLWQPEDGSVAPITAFVRTGERTECRLRLDAGQGSFVVIDNTAERPTKGGVDLVSSNLLGAKITQSASGNACVTGLLPAGTKRAEARLVVSTSEGSAQPRHLSAVAAFPPVPLTLDGSWDFLPVGDQLDSEWRVDVHAAVLALPVMRARWERGGSGIESGWHLPGCDDRRWRSVKIQDALHPQEGAHRYRSKWDARHISFYEYRSFDMDRFFVPEIGGRGLQCRTALMLPPEIRGGWVAVVCRSPFRVLLNGQECAVRSGGLAPDRIELRGLQPGEVELRIVAENAAAILAEGQFEVAYGSPIPIVSDATWEVAVDGQDWQPAWEYVAPPEAPYGEPIYPGERPMPTVVWYRQALPPGTDLIHEPHVDGEWQAWVDGAPLHFTDGAAPIAAQAAGGMLAVRVVLQGDQAGLVDPVRIRCVPSAQPLGSWTNQNLEWYSGRALYATSVDIPAEYCRNDVRLQLDLGKVGYCAEIWVNNRLVTTRIWHPYRADITEFVQPGTNRIQVVASNLLANRMRWDIFDDVKGALQNRKWHDSEIRRDGWCLESGLIGPVRILPCRVVSVDAEIAATE